MTADRRERGRQEEAIENVLIERASHEVDKSDRERDAAVEVCVTDGEQRGRRERVEDGERDGHCRPTTSSKGRLAAWALRRRSASHERIGHQTPVGAWHPLGESVDVGRARASTR